MAAPGGRTRPLRCFSIRVLSSASWSLSDVDCIAAGIGRVENLVRKSATFYTKFIKLNKRGKKRPKFTPFVCLRSLWSKEPGRQVPIERHGRPRPCERRGPTVVGRMSASEPFDGTRDRGGDNYHVSGVSPLRNLSYYKKRFFP